MSLLASSTPQLKKKARLVHDAIDNRFMVLFPEAALVLADTAPGILRLCDGKRTIETIAQTLASQYQAPVDVVQADVMEFLQLIYNRGLLDA